MTDQQRIQQFFDLIQSEMAVSFATAADGRVSMRLVSPVRLDGAILLFTSSASLKYRQLAENPNACLAVGPFFAECTAELRGPTMADENQALRDAYCAKFPGAFDEGIPFGGREDDFVVLHPRRLTGWGFENDTPSADGVPTVPFEILL